MKKIVILFTSIMLVIVMTSCGSKGSNDWSFNDNVLTWGAVDNTMFYELVPHDEDGNLVENALKMFVYDNQVDLGQKFRDGQEFHFIIKSYLEDGTTVESDMIHVTVDGEFPHPITIGKNYLATKLEWPWVVDPPSSPVVDYTVQINDEEIDTTETFLDIAGAYDNGIYQFQVKVNYANGSSEWTEPYWYSMQQDVEEVYAFFDPNDNQDVTITFDEDIVAVTGEFLLSSNRVIPESVASINGNQVTINQYYIFNPSTDNFSENMLFDILTLYSENTVYALYITNNETLVD
jgi:hypothetical protein